MATSMNAKVNVFTRFKKKILKNRGYNLSETNCASSEVPKCVSHTVRADVNHGRHEKVGRSVVKANMDGPKGILIEHDNKIATTPRKCRNTDRESRNGFSTMPVVGTPVKKIYRVDPKSQINVSGKESSHSNTVNADCVKSPNRQHVDDVDGSFLNQPPLCARCHSVTVVEGIQGESGQTNTRSKMLHDKMSRSMEEPARKYEADVNCPPPMFMKRRQSSEDSDSTHKMSTTDVSTEKHRKNNRQCQVSAPVSITHVTLEIENIEKKKNNQSTMSSSLSDENDEIAKRLTKSGDSGYSDGPHSDPGFIMTSSVEEEEEEEEVFSDTPVTTATGSSSDDEADYTIVGDADVEFVCEHMEAGCIVQDDDSSQIAAALSAEANTLPSGDIYRRHTRMYETAEEPAVVRPTGRQLYAHVPKGAARSSLELTETSDQAATERSDAATKNGSTITGDGDMEKENVKLECAKGKAESGIDSDDHADNDNSDVAEPDDADDESPPLPLRKYQLPADKELSMPEPINREEEPTHMSWDEVCHEAQTLGITLKPQVPDDTYRPRPPSLVEDHTSDIQRRHLPSPPVTVDRLHASVPLRSQSRGSLRSLDTGIGQSRSSLSLDAGMRRARMADPPASPSSNTGTSSTSSEPAANRNADFISSLSKLKDCGWYWGPLSWDDAEAKLADKPDGSFLVRDSSDDRYILSLTFRSQSTTHHTRIEHYKGTFSFYSQPKSHGATNIVEFIERAMEHSRSGRFLYFLRPRAPGLPPAPIQLLRPVSRFTARVPSLQHMCRFSVLRRVRRDHIMQLPVPLRLKDYLQQSQYYAETAGGGGVPCY